MAAISTWTVSFSLRIVPTTTTKLAGKPTVVSTNWILPGNTSIKPFETVGTAPGAIGDLLIPLLALIMLVPALKEC
jgi:hypothetical protein